ncbi:MAG: saccharopine dehydrogenase NADP-binding domain-containing protein [Pseudomonadales bacterium]|nr:saccharopine dehydrogenase NADP-binding domain-containing protein [Pseudomonadales bacterium]
MYKVLILGGYGNFGKRIAESLSVDSDLHLLIAGRHGPKAERLCAELRSSFSSNVYTPVVMDITAADFAVQLKALAVDLVVHTSGPFQGQDHRVPLACIAAGAHYIDLADDRDFVCGIAALNAAAVEAGVMVVSGASSVPGLSSCVVAHFQTQFSQLDSIDVAIAPGNKAERGEATVRGILSYTGHGFKSWQQGHWVDVYGWMSPQRMDFKRRIGKRWLANVDVPDLQLFPAYFSGVQRVTFQAGLELPFLHLTMVAMGWLAKRKLVRNWAALTPLIMAASRFFDRFGSADGAMQVSLQGRDGKGKAKTLLWRLYAYDGVGPYIPTISAVILANQLIRGEDFEAGARACMCLYSLDEFDEYAKALNLVHETQVQYG